jgi:hypothetical protein
MQRRHVGHPQDAWRVRTWGAALRRPYEENGLGKTHRSKRDSARKRRLGMTSFFVRETRRRVARGPTCRGGIWGTRQTGSNR